MFSRLAYCLVMMALFVSGAAQESIGELALPGEDVYPEGIAYSESQEMLFVGSSSDGTIFRSRPGDDEFEVFIEAGEGGLNAAFGMTIDDQQRLWVAGGPTGTVGVFDSETGENLATLQAPAAQNGTFLNDLVAASDGYVYITDSYRPTLFRAQVDEGGAGELEAWLDLAQSPIEYGGEGEGPEATNLNGIVVSEDGSSLITVDMNDGRLYRIGLDDQQVEEIDLGGETIVNGDGLVLHGHTLYVVRLTENEVVTIELAEDYSSGSIEARFSDDDLNWPATARLVGDRLFLVNTQFDRQQQGEPELPFTVAAVPLPAVQQGQLEAAQEQGEEQQQEVAAGGQAQEAWQAAAEMRDGDGNSVGSAVFMAEEEGAVRIEVELTEFTGASGGEHGIHIHEVGQCEPPGFESAGDHFNPTQQQHGLNNPEGPHAGDLPNIEVDGEGSASYETTSDRITLEAGERSILDEDGSALVIHANPDDQATDPSGNSGDPIACGVIAAGEEDTRAEAQDEAENQQQDEEAEQQQEAEAQQQDEEGEQEEGVISDYTPVSDERLREPEDANWLMWLRNYGAWSYSPLEQINRDNVSRLRPVWTFSTGLREGHESPPIVNDGIMFVTTPENQVLAFDAASGDLLWRYERDLPHDLFQLHPTNRGVALYQDKVYLATLDTYLVALDASTGEVVWERAVEDYQEAYYMTLAPLAADGKIMVGVSGGELGVRGFVQAFDAESGDTAWKTYTIPAPGEPGNDTWPGNTWQHGGAPVWITGSYDPELNLSYWGTGNAAPWTGDARPGDNLYSTSVVAIDVETGELVAHHQYHQNGSWDWDEVATPLLIDFERDGETMRGLMHVARDGYLWWLERSEDEISFVDATPYVNQNVFESLDPETGRPTYNEERKPAIDQEADFCPSLWGGKDWPPASYNPRTGYIYIPANDNHCGRMSGIEEEYVAGQTYFGARSQFYIAEGADHIGELQAWDVNTGEQVWVHEFEDSHTWGPVMSTGGGLVFTGGTNDRFFRAFDAETGELLWQHRTNSGINAVPVSFEVDGVQYIAVQSGWGVDAVRFQGAVAADQGGSWNMSVPQGGVIWVFALEDSESVAGGGGASPAEEDGQSRPAEEGEGSQEGQQQESGGGNEEESE